MDLLESVDVGVVPPRVWGAAQQEEWPAVVRDEIGSELSVKARRDTGVRFLGNHSRGEYAEHLGDVYVRAVDLPKSPLRASGACVA